MTFDTGTGLGLANLRKPVGREKRRTVYRNAMGRIKGPNPGRVRLFEP